MIHAREGKKVCVYIHTEKTTNTLLYLLQLQENIVFLRNKTESSFISDQAVVLDSVTPVTNLNSTDIGLKSKKKNTYTFSLSRACIRLLTGAGI